MSRPSQLSEQQNPISDWRLWAWILAVLVSGFMLDATPVEESNPLTQTNVDSVLASRE